MRKQSHRRVRTRPKLILNTYTRRVRYFAYMQVTNKWRDWTFRTVSLRQAEMLATMNEATKITRLEDGVIRVVGYRATKPTSWERPSPTTLTFGTLIAVGNEALHGQLTRWQRDEIVKFRVWPLIGDTKAVAVRPRISDAERVAAEKMLKQGYPRTNSIPAQAAA